MGYPTGPGVMPRYDQATRYLTRTAYRVLWADGRGVQYFLDKYDAYRFYEDYRDWDSKMPELVHVPKGARIQRDYHGPHPGVKKQT